FQAEDGIRDSSVTEFRRVLFRSLLTDAGVRPAAVRRIAALVWPHRPARRLLAVAVAVAADRRAVDRAVAGRRHARRHRDRAWPRSEERRVGDEGWGRW